MTRLSIIALTALLAGCATTISDPVCPPLAVYPPAVQDRAADELAALPAGAALARLIEDYGELRARLRAACLNSR